MSAQVLALLFSKSSLAKVPSRDLSILAEVFFRYTSQVAVRPGEAIFLELNRSQKIYSTESIRLRVAALLKRMQIPVQMALAEDPGTALALARFQAAKKGGLPLAALFDYASPFQMLDESDALRRNLDRKIFLLKGLGVKDLSGFLALPEKSVVNHLGGDMLSVYDAVKDSRGLPWPRFQPSEKVIESLSIREEQQVSNNMEGLSFLFKNILDRLTMRLRGRSERMLKFEVNLELEKHSQSEGRRFYVFELTSSHVTTRDLLFMIRERIGFDLQMRPLSALIEGISIATLEVAPYGLAQKDLFHPKREEESEAWRSLLARISEKLGPGKIFLGKPMESYRPESAWEKSTEEKTDEKINHQEDTMNNAERPLRLFKRPIRVSSLWLQNVQILNEPEILSGEWWTLGFERIYFRVRDQVGEEFWVFRNQIGTFIHGAWT